MGDVPERQGEKYVPPLHYSFLTPLYDAVTAMMGDRHFRMRLMVLAGVRPEDALLDVGCGTGTFAVMAKQRYPRSFVSGLDPDLRALAFALRKSYRAGVDVPFVRGSATHLPYSGGAFDKVFSSLVFHHLTREGKRVAMSEIMRVLKPAGEFYLVDFGKPTNVLMAALTAFGGVFESTRDNRKGLLPLWMTELGFMDVTAMAHIGSPFGTIAVYRGRKPGRLIVASRTAVPQPRSA